MQPDRKMQCWSKCRSTAATVHFRTSSGSSSLPPASTTPNRDVEIGSAERNIRPVPPDCGLIKNRSKSVERRSSSGIGYTRPARRGSTTTDLLRRQETTTTTETRRRRRAIGSRSCRMSYAFRKNRKTSIGYCRTSTGNLPSVSAVCKARVLL